MRNPRRAGSPERGHARPPVPQDLETQAGRDVNPAQRVGRERTRTRKRARKAGRRESSGGDNVKEAATQRPARVVRARARRREERPEVGRVRPLHRGARRRRCGNAKRVGSPERGVDRREEKASKRKARGRSGAARRSEGRWWRSRRRYPNLARGTPWGRKPHDHADPPSRHVSWGKKAQGRCIVEPRGPQGSRDGAGA